MNLEQLATLPLNSRIQAMEILWTSMDSVTADTSPKWHLNVLKDRLGEIDNKQYSVWDDAKKRLKAKSTLH